MMQNGQPVAYASCALTLVESRYAQVEKELLVPIAKSLLKPRYSIKQDVKELRTQKQCQQQYYNPYMGCRKDLKPMYILTLVRQ